MFTLHPPFSSFPLALIVVAALLEVARLFTRRDWIESCISVCVALGAVLVAHAFFTGYVASEHANATFSVPDEVIALHHTFGRFLLFAMVPCVALRFISIGATHGKLGFTVAYRAFLSICVALVVYTGYLGGQLVFEYGAGVTAQISAIQAPAAKTPSSNP